MPPLFESREFTTLKFETTFSDRFVVSRFGLFFKLHD